MTSTDDSGIHMNIAGHVATLTIDNPPANTWTSESLTQLKQHMDTLESDRTIYAIVLTGKGEKFFSAGAELRLFADSDKSVALDMAHRFSEAFEALSAFRGVTIAAINGYAMGGGLEAALACDIRIAEHQAVMALPEAKVGLLPCAGGTQNLTALVGEGWAKRIILCGEQVSAEQAHQIGLAEEVVPSGRALQAATRLAESVAGQSPSSVAACKALIQAGRHTTRAHALIEERELFMKLFEKEDQAEGVSAFLEKRSPVWKNR